MAGGVMVDEFGQGFLLGILVGEGHFGGTGRTAQVTVRMHVRHRYLFVWLLGAVRGSRLYGPYRHGGREYYQWMITGTALREYLWPLLQERFDFFDDHIRHRIAKMAVAYGLPLEESRLAQGRVPSQTPQS
jgi:hypothetical protein